MQNTRLSEIDILLVEELASLPEYVVGESRSSKTIAGQALGLAESGGIASLGRKFSDAVDRAGHTQESLTIFLNRRVYETTKAHNRAKFWWGRYYNRGIGENANFIKLSWIHLVQALDVIECTPISEGLSNDTLCLLRIDIADEILQHLKVELDNVAN